MKPLIRVSFVKLAHLLGLSDLSTEEVRAYHAVSDRVREHRATVRSRARSLLAEIGECALTRWQRHILGFSLRFSAFVAAVLLLNIGYDAVSERLNGQRMAVNTCMEPAYLETAELLHSLSGLGDPSLSLIGSDSVPMGVVLVDGATVAAPAAGADTAMEVFRFLYAVQVCRSIESLVARRRQAEKAVLEAVAVAFETCMGGPGVTGRCGPLDYDEDGDVDMVDFARFQQTYAGP